MEILLGDYDVYSVLFHSGFILLISHSVICCFLFLQMI